MSCPVCGAPYPADANFCRMCGNKRDEASAGLGVGAGRSMGSPSALSSFNLQAAPSMVVGGSNQGYAPAYLQPSSMASMAPSYAGPESYGAPSPSYTSFVSQPGLQGYRSSAGTSAGRDLSSAAPGESWDNGGFRYTMGDRYLQDAQGNNHSVLPSGNARGTSSGGGSFATAMSSGYAAQGYTPGHYGPAGPDHIHDLHAAHVISQPGQHHGPLPPHSAPGTPSMLPPYMHPEASGKAPKRDKKDKKSKKDRDPSRRRKKGGCC